MSRRFPDTAGRGRRQRFEGTEGSPTAEAPRERHPEPAVRVAALVRRSAASGGANPSSSTEAGTVHHARLARSGSLAPGRDDTTTSINWSHGRRAHEGY